MQKRTDKILLEIFKLKYVCDKFKLPQRSFVPAPGQLFVCQVLGKSVLLQILDIGIVDPGNTFRCKELCRIDPYPFANRHLKSTISIDRKAGVVRLGGRTVDLYFIPDVIRARCAS